MDLTDSELYECGGCSNFIPSSESDPPPPITYHVTECKPGDIHLQECDANTESAPALDESDTMVSQDCSFEASDAVKKQDTFTQADDFQDLSKENLEPSSNTVGLASEKIPQSVQVNGFSFNGPNRIGKSLGHTQDLFDETPNQPMRFSEPLNASKNNTNSSNSPFLSGLESHSSSLARLPSSASVLFNSSDGVVKSKGGAGSMMKKSPKQLVKNKISQSVDSILAVNVSAIIYRLDDTNDLIFDSRFNVKINDSNIKDAYHRLQNDNAKLINELSRLLKRECDNVGQIKTSDSMLSTSPPTNDSSHSNVLSSKSIFRSSSISTSNSDCVRPKVWR
ncbi:unnamed protein product [Heterobilharzia americana]|nr:unnamed protein product [Heterobilharzia americana]